MPQFVLDILQENLEWIAWRSYWTLTLIVLCISFIVSFTKNEFGWFLGTCLCLFTLLLVMLVWLG